ARYPQVEVVEPVSLRPSLEPGLQVLPRARGIVRRQPHHVRAETRAEERRPQAVASPLGLPDEGAQPPRQSGHLAHEEQRREVEELRGEDLPVDAGTLLAQDRLRALAVLSRLAPPAVE